MKPRLIVEQKITAFVNRYAVYEANDDGEKRDLLAFAQQKRLAFRESIIFYGDEKRTQEAFTVRAEKIIDVHGRYVVSDTSGSQLGAFKKLFKKSLLNSTWQILDENGKPVLEVSESNKFLAVFRRFVDFIPVVGDLGELIAMLFRYHFVFKDADTGETIGRYKKTTLFRDHYELSMTDQAYQQQAWQVLAAMAVALDALQSR